MQSWLPSFQRRPADLLDVSQLLAQAKKEKATTFEPQKVVKCDGH
jgi:hypothetical protein